MTFTWAEAIDESPDSELVDAIQAGDVVVNDGVDDLSVADGISFLKHSDYALHVRFASDPERSNGFAARDVQAAIEESNVSATGTLSPLTFVQSGNVKDKWLGFANNAGSSQDIPFVAIQPYALKGITFANDNDDVDIDIEVYKNAVLFTTVSVRNKRWYYDYDIGSLSGAQGDRLSVFFKSVVGGTGNDTAKDPMVALYVKFTSEIDASGGAQTGVS
jgi:hypothetical protein